MLLDIIPSKTAQKDLFINEIKMDNKKLMDVLDNINRKYGQKTLQFAVCGYQKAWSMKQDSISKSFTTSWSDLLVVKAN